MLLIDQIIPKKRALKKNKYVVLFIILVVLVVLIIFIFNALKLNRSKVIADKNRNKVSTQLSGLICQKQLMLFDIFCFIQKNQLASEKNTQESRQSEAYFGSNSGVFATSFLKVKRLKNQSKLLIKRVVVLLKYRFFEVRERLEENQVRVEEIAKLSQSKDSLAMLKGLVLGEKITQNTYYALFQKAGLLHILVASGFNVALLTGLVTKKIVFFSRKTKSLVSLVIIWLYVWFLEGDPPLLRAGVMLSLLILANQVGRAISSRRVLIYSVFILLFFNLELIKSLSFWFSVLATLGLILFSGQFLLFSSGELTITSFFRQEFLASLAAQILLLPLVIWFFGELNWLSFISNSLFLFPVAWFTQVGFVLVGLLAWFKNSYLELLFWPYLLIYRYVIASFISLVGQLRFLFFLRQTVLPEEKDFYLLVWGMGLLVLIVFLRRKHNRKVVFFHENC